MNPPPFLRALAAGAMWCVATATAVTIVSQPALADRPGGPANATASACGDKLRRPPAICVTFDNTASEPVRFMAELTIDGQPVSPLTLAGQIVCDRPQTSCVASRTISFDFGADPFHIGALPKTNGKSWSINADGSGYVPPEGFEIVAPSVKLVVEVDGGYHAARAGADRRRDAQLLRLGFRTLRISAERVRNDMPAVLELIRSVL